MKRGSRARKAAAQGRGVHCGQRLAPGHRPLRRWHPRAAGRAFAASWHRLCRAAAPQRLARQARRAGLRHPAGHTVAQGTPQGRARQVQCQNALWRRCRLRGQLCFEEHGRAQRPGTPPRRPGLCGRCAYTLAGPRWRPGHGAGRRVSRQARYASARQKKRYGCTPATRPLHHRPGTAPRSTTAWLSHSQDLTARWPW